MSKTRKTILMKKTNIFRKGTRYILPLGTNYLNLHKLLIYLLCVKLTIFLYYENK